MVAGGGGAAAAPAEEKTDYRGPDWRWRQ